MLAAAEEAERKANGNAVNAARAAYAKARAEALALAREQDAAYQAQLAEWQRETDAWRQAEEDRLMGFLVRTDGGGGPPACLFHTPPCQLPNSEHASLTCPRGAAATRTRSLSPCRTRSARRGRRSGSASTAGSRSSRPRRRVPARQRAANSTRTPPLHFCPTSRHAAAMRRHRIAQVGLVRQLKLVLAFEDYTRRTQTPAPTPVQPQAPDAHEREARRARARAGLFCFLSLRLRSQRPPAAACTQEGEISSPHGGSPDDFARDRERDRERERERDHRDWSPGREGRGPGGYGPPYGCVSLRTAPRLACALLRLWRGRCSD